MGGLDTRLQGTFERHLHLGGEPSQGQRPTAGGCLHPHLPIAEWSTRPGPRSQFPEKLNALLELISYDSQHCPWTPLCALSDEGREPSRVACAAGALETPRLAALRECTLGKSHLPWALKEEQSPIGTLQGVQRLRSLQPPLPTPTPPQEVSSQRCYANLA